MVTVAWVGTVAGKHLGDRGGNRAWEPGVGTRRKGEHGGLGALASGPVGVSLADSPRSTAGDICPVEMCRGRLWKPVPATAWPAGTAGGERQESRAGSGAEVLFKTVELSLSFED